MATKTADDAGCRVDAHFTEPLLGALVAFGSVITIEPVEGALAFCAVAILTMFAAETFDPRLMWDAAEQKQPQMLAESAT